MVQENLIWATLYCRDRDFEELARRAMSLHQFREMAERHKLPCTAEYDDGSWYLAIHVPTKRLESFLGQLAGAGDSFGPVDCWSEEALAICRRLQVEAELIEPVA